MAAFGLDDVRESFTSDVTRFLGEIERNAKAVVSAATLATPAERTWQVPIHAMVVGLHGIVGSSSLIGLDSMSGTARRLEDIAGSAAESIRMLRLHANRLRQIATLCLEGSSDLRSILEEELAGHGAEAATRSRALDARLEAGVKQLDAPPQPEGVPSPVLALPAIPPPAAKRDTDDGWDEPAAAPAPAPAPPTTRAAAPAALGPDDELAEVFRDEARATLTNLAGYVARLQAQPRDLEAVAQCARLLHLLKGAAASVGLDAIAQAARDLHTRVDTARVTGLDPGAVTELARGIEALTERVLPEHALAAPAPAPVAAPAPQVEHVDEDDPRHLFRDEARNAVGELRALMQQMHGTTGTARGVGAARVERILHRLKGSALIVGEVQLSTVAARGQALCEALERVELGLLGDIIDQIGAAVASTATSPAPASRALHQVTLPGREEWEVYLEESSELLDELERTLIKVERSARPSEELATMFRTYHTLKGASNAVGLAPVGQHLHIIETFIERLVAAPALPELEQIVRVLSEQHGELRRNIARASSHGTVELDHDGLGSRLSSIGGDRPSSGVSWIAASDPVWIAPSGDAGRSAEHASQSARASDVSEASEVVPARPETDDLGSEPAAAARRFVRVAADRLDGLLDLAGELVVSRSRILARLDRMQQLQEADHHRHDSVVRLVGDFATSTQFTNLDGHRRRIGPGRAATAVGSTGFGSLELDHYEEIHVLSRQLDEAASDIHEMRREIGAAMKSLAEDTESLSTIVSDLQSEITQARMLTIESLFTRLHLPIRDAARRLAREVEIVTSGEDVAIDKAISDALFGPLLHMVRNAVVHGIERPDVRLERGKPRAGAIAMSARQEQGQVILEVTDDGAGIDTAKLKALGVARGLIPDEMPETDPRVLELVFVHGLSTSDEAGDVAGRGVGGNVIRRAIDRLNGSIQITTTPNAGTTFRIALPVSRSITQAVLVRSAGVTLAVPISFAEAIVAADGVELVDSFGRTRAKIAGNLMPVHQTRHLFSGSPTAGAVYIVCVVGGERVAIQADEVVGQEEIVVKSLGTLLDGHPLFSGSTQRGDGELVLIVDVPGALAAEAREYAPEVDRGHRPSVSEPEPLPAPVSAAVSTREEAPAKPAIAVEEIAPIPTGKLRVLFVDDSLSVRKVGERMLAGLGVDVVTAVDGQDALEKLRAMSFSLVFTDLEMPRMHGYDLIREMQYLPAYRAIPVVVISSRSGAKHIEQALSMGAREYLTKPFSPEILSGVLSRFAGALEREPS